MSTAATILEQALQLPPAERAELCGEPWKSLDESEIDAVNGLEAEQMAELRRRLDHFEQFPDDVLEWESVKAEVLTTRRRSA